MGFRVSRRCSTTVTSACAGAKLSIRAATVATATRRLLADGVIDASGEGPPERVDYDYLVSLKGIGPYAAAHCRMLRHDFSRLPVDFPRDRPSSGAIRLRPREFATSGPPGDLIWHLATGSPDNAISSPRASPPPSASPDIRGKIGENHSFST